eukprot:CAMPEP_0181133676 /NCGR_PEP_ID=MMETSP1071-20121207/31652_1 /TAXON_ID=35127 /ORGANISM="Thalassiosira sp., Strain NH16" /LENGTH=240 /DNA_ID=CAMNT_0023220085 /DNA_START=120 /DNA_END=839 /DNA_ORIENTATION=-
MTLSIGCHEIAAAKCRLAAAKIQESSASKMIETANSMADTAKNMAETAQKMAESAKSMASEAKKNKGMAQSLMNSSKAEVQAAEDFLKEAENRWEVIDVDASDSPQQENKSRKKNKESSANTAGVLRPNNNGRRDSGTVQQHQGTVSDDVCTSSISDCSQIEIKGCGMKELNGKYTKEIDPTERIRFWDSKHRSERRGFIYYWDGFWHVCIINTRGNWMKNLYRTMNSCSNEEPPPEKGW